MGIFRSGCLRAAYALVTLSWALMLPLAARAYTPEQQKACSGDAFRLCNSEIPDVDRITACMIRNKAQLSPECRTQFGPSRSTARTSDDPPAGPRSIKPAAKHKAASGKSHKAKKVAKRETT